MKKLTKTFALLMSISMLAGCSSSTSSDSDTATSDSETTTDTTNTESSEASKTAKIGIIQYAEHPALDQATEGFKDYLIEQGYSEDSFDFKNAQGEQANCTTIAQTFVNDADDLIYAVATPAAQASATATQDMENPIPIVVSAVTDPESSGLVESNDKPGTNVTGASDLNPIEEQLNLLKKVIPDAAKIAIMYCNAEENSRYQAALAEAYCDEIGLEYVEAPVTDSNQIQQVVESLIGKVDAIYIGTDNLLAEGMATVTQVANENNLPCFVGEEGMVSNGGLITYGIDYYELGKIAGAQALAILEDGEDPADMAIEYLPEDKLTITVNLEAAEKLGITIPDDILEEAVVVSDEDEED